MNRPRTFSLAAVLPILAVVALIAFFAGRGGRDHASGGGAEHADAGEPTLWTCSMHPQIILPSNDQKCPICFMDLIPLRKDAGAGLDPGSLRLSPAAVALAEIRTERAERRAVTRPLRLAGRITADETLVRTITARFPGRLERLHVDATGVTVRAGAPLADIYSPEILAAAAELRAAAAAAAADPASAPTLQAAAERLRLLGLEPAQVEGLRRGEASAERLTVRAPLGGVVLHRRATLGQYVRTGDELYAIADLARVWLRLDALEADLPWIREGQDVAFTVRGRPGDTFRGTVAFVDPVVDERTRSVEVRVVVDNASGELKPGMLATGVIDAALPGSGESLVIPATAPLLTGARAVVYVREPGEGDPVFRGREVALGARTGDWYVVTGGLQEGDEVVTHGAFKIDSALQIRAEPSMMAPPAAAGPAAAAPAAAPAAAVPAADSACLQQGLAGVLDAYLPLQAALAADDDGAAAAAARNVSDHLGAIACDDADAGWSALGAELAGIARIVADADGIAARRLAFEPLSDGLWVVLDRYAVGDVRGVRRFHCPMAMDGAGAFWLQQGATTANPYYGASMLRCGEQKAVLGDPDQAKGN